MRHFQPSVSEAPYQSIACSRRSALDAGLLETSPMMIVSSCQISTLSQRDGWLQGGQQHLMMCHLELRVRCNPSCARSCLGGLHRTFIHCRPESHLPSVSFCEQVPQRRRAKYSTLVHRALLQLAAAADPLVSFAAVPPPTRQASIIGVIMTSVICSWNGTGHFSYFHPNSEQFYSST